MPTVDGSKAVIEASRLQSDKIKELDDIIGKINKKLSTEIREAKGEIEVLEEKVEHLHKRANVNTIALCVITSVVICGLMWLFLSFHRG